MKIATWNVNSLRVRLPHVLAWLKDNPVDALCLQETKVEDGKFPLADIEAAGYRAVFSGQKTYNGVAILARAQPGDVEVDIPGLDDPERRIIAATIGGVRVLNLYVVNGREVGHPMYTRKLAWLGKVADYIKAEVAFHPRFVVVGDFNVAPADADVHDPDAWRDRILCSDPEREALARVQEAGALQDCFRLFEQKPETFSWWDYRNAGFPRNHGLRIDLILATAETQCTSCVVDPTPRGWEKPSDHTVVVAEFK